MLKSNLEGYIDTRSIVHKINPLVKIWGLITYILISLLKFNKWIFICNISLVFILILLSNVPLIYYVKVLWKLKYIIIIYYFVMLNGFNIALMNTNVYLFKGLFFIYYILVIYKTTSKEELGKTLGVCLNLFNLIGYPLKKIKMFFINRLYDIYRFFNLYYNLKLDVQLHGIDYEHGTIIDKGKVIGSNFGYIIKLCKEKRNKRKVELGYRMFNHYNSSIRYKNKLCLYDYILLIVGVGMIIYYIMEVR